VFYAKIYNMNTKEKGDIAEYAVVAEALKRGFNVLIPIGDRLPYDLVIERNGKFIRIQVKWAWKDNSKDSGENSYAVSTRKSHTNSKGSIYSRYDSDAFDFLIAYIEERNLFYVMPISFYLSRKSSIHLNPEPKKYGRIPDSEEYNGAWELINTFDIGR